MSILLKLFLVFSHIGLFNFGGGYAMLSFIQAEVVYERQWMTETEFTDIVAISQMTPGPIGINCATYVGYTAVMNDPEMKVMFADSPHLLQCMGVLGSCLATFGVLWLPFIVMILISALILRYKNSIVLKKHILDIETSHHRTFGICRIRTHDRFKLWQFRREPDAIRY